MDPRNFETRESIVSMGCMQTQRVSYDWYSNKQNTVEIEVSIDGKGNLVVAVDGKPVFEASEHQCRSSPERGWQNHRCERCGEFKR